MERTTIAFILMAFLIAAGIGIGLYLRHHGRERTIRRDRARDKDRREAKAANGR